MKKRVFLLALSLLTALFVSVMTSFAVMAEEQSSPDTSDSSETSSEPESTEQAPDTEEPEPSPYTLEFLTGSKKIYNMTEKNGSYYCTVNFAEGGELYPLVVKNNGVVTGGQEFLLYKENGGEVEFSYNTALGVKAACSEGDAFGAFSYSDHPYYISVVGGKLENLPTEFNGKNISAFYYDAGESVSFSAIVDEDKQFKAWECEDDHIELPETASVKLTLPKAAGKSITIKAILENKSLSLEQMLIEHKNITLEEDYLIDKTIELVEGEYVIDLGGHKIECATTVFTLNGATLTIEGEGEVKSTGKNGGYGIKVEKGNLIIEGGKYAGHYSAIDASAGQINIKGGEFACGTQTAVSIMSPCELLISGGEFSDTASTKHAISVNGGKLTVNGGKFYGKTAVKKWKDDSDIQIYAGSFESDVSEFVAEGSAGKTQDGLFVVTPDENIYTLTVIGGKGGGLYKVGETVQLTLDKTGQKTAFKGWVVVSGSFTITDTKAESFSFKMPAFDMTIKAEFEGTETTAPETTAPVTTAPVTTPVGGVTEKEEVTTDSDDKIQQGGSSTGLVICIIILIVLLIAAIAIAVILIIKKMNESREEAERSELSSSVVDDLADRLAMLNFGAAASEEANRQRDSRPQPTVPVQGQPRIRRPRTRPTANFEPEDLTVTKEHSIDKRDGE